MGHTPPPERAGAQLQRRHVWDEPERVMRQTALLVDFRGDCLKPDEIGQLERYQALNPAVPLRRKIVWLPQDGSFASSNDIIWKEQGGQQFEMKTSGARYKAISSAIKDAVSAARNNLNGATVKDRFFVDIKAVRLSDKLRHQLGLYNCRRRLKMGPL